MRKSQKPEITEGDDIHSDHKESHPAYSVLQISRVSGHATLFDSEFRHQHYITLRISGAEVNRNLSNNWIYDARLPYIEVNMSEAQFATAISSLNCGAGTPCTLSYLNGESIPRIERDAEHIDNKFKEEMKKAFAEVSEVIGELDNSITDGKMTKALKKELLWKVEELRRRCGGSTTEFVANQYSEHMERVKEKGKAELHAHALRLGLTENVLLDDKSADRIASPSQGGE